MKKRQQSEFSYELMLQPRKYLDYIQYRKIYTIRDRLIDEQQLYHQKTLKD